MGELGDRRYKEGGVRKGFAVANGSSQISVMMWCEGPLTKAALWIDGKLVNGRRLRGGRMVSATTGSCGTDRRTTVLPSTP